MADRAHAEQAFWDRLARYDPLWAILSDPSRTGRRWDLRSFLETGRREVSLLMYRLQGLDIHVRLDAALDFGCGVGRLSQPLARYFARVVGVDVSPEMIRLANAINRFPTRVAYLCNVRDDLAPLATGEFTFMYSAVVLQHIEPSRALQYLKELLRVIAPGGVMVFQLPSHLRSPDEPRPVSTAMIEQAYRASVRVESDVPNPVAPGSEMVLAAAVTNTSAGAWSRSEAGPIRLGNHWLSASGHAMLIQDDGRASLPENVQPGQTCRVTIKVVAPPEPGRYQLECDVVHEGIAWFADKGSPTWRSMVNVGSAGASSLQAPGEARDMNATDMDLALPDVTSVELPGPLPMYGIPCDVVARVVEEHGGRLVHREPDERCGNEWIGYRYFVRKK